MRRTLFPRRPVRSTGLLAVGVVLIFGYTVDLGDTLSELAQRFGIPTSTLSETNGIDDPDRLIAGTTLRVPDRSADGGGAGGGSAAGRHRVQLGETLSGLASRFGVATRALAQANGLDDPDRLIAGTRLAIPAADESPDAGTPGGSGDVAALLERTARAHGWSPAFVKALAWQESGWQQHRVSSAGAVGIMQVLPGTGRFVSDNLAGRRLDLDDPADNVLAGVLFLDHLYDLTDGDAERTLAGYYQGLASVRANGRYDDTERYIDNVLALRERFR